ncbi:MAG: hypothetical protein GTO18_12400 [Anaerolineales bacterium]|nr:hypothetical protein [Anaerolineales bacterium]
MKIKLIPPTYLNVLLILEILLHFIAPVRQIVEAPFTYFGVILLIAGLLLNIYTVRYLERFGTTINYLEDAHRLVVTGPFRRSRNPIYLSGVMLSLGIAIFLGSLITFVIPILLFLLLNYLYIPNEELRLEELFGNEFVEYKHRVRRWI